MPPVPSSFVRAISKGPDLIYLFSYQLRPCILILFNQRLAESAPVQHQWAGSRHSHTCARSYTDIWSTSGIDTVSSLLHLAGSGPPPPENEATFVCSALQPAPPAFPLFAWWPLSTGHLFKTTHHADPPPPPPSRSPCLPPTRPKRVRAIFPPRQTTLFLTGSIRPAASSGPVP